MRARRLLGDGSATLTWGGGASVTRFLDGRDANGHLVLSPRTLPDRLVGSELTAYRTLALREAVANNPHVAMTALLHKLCLDTFQHAASGNCLEASVHQVFFSIQPADLKDSPPAKAVAERHEAWKADLPKGEAQLWDWLAVLDDTSRAALLAHCVSFGVNALHEKGDRYGGPGRVHPWRPAPARSGRPARGEVELDMVEAGWRPTVDDSSLAV